MIDEILLRAVMARIMPADRDGGAAEFGAEAYVAKHFAGNAADEKLIADGISTLVGFTSLDTEKQDAALGAVEGAAWFRLLCELVAEGVYADPGNGGNPDAASWKMVGYDHRLPEGPSGPEGRAGRPPEAYSGTLTSHETYLGSSSETISCDSGDRVNTPSCQPPFPVHAFKL